MRIIENIKQSPNKGMIDSVWLMDYHDHLILRRTHYLQSNITSVGYLCVLLNQCLATIVKLSNNVNDQQCIYKGAAQASIMGLLSYSIFSNDMLFPLDNDAQIYNYADDNTLQNTGYSYDQVKEKLLSSVSIVTTWLEADYMKANPDEL